MVGAWTLPACGGSNCPAPTFGEPVSVTWPPSSSTSTGVTGVVLRWTANGDPLPERYYEPFSVESGGDAGYAPVTAARRTGARELTLDMRDFDAYVRTHPRFTVLMRFPDTMQYVSCQHPGMSDAYVVNVTFDFDVTAHTATARFAPSTILFPLR